MEEKGSYKTISNIASGLYKEKGSKFMGFVHPATTIDEAKKIIADYKQKHHNARHHCFAYIIGTEYQHERAYDDGEPQHSGGSPILGQIKSFELTNTLLIVVRYFGGTKLGVSNLTNAYKQAAGNTLQNAKITEQNIQEYFTLQCPHNQIQIFYRIASIIPINIINQDLSEEAILTISVPKKNVKKFINKIQQTPINIKE